MTGGRDDVHVLFPARGESTIGGSRGGEHSRGKPLVVGGRDGAQVKQQPAALDPADDRRHISAAHHLT
jgi:hypothetical protein